MALLKWSQYIPHDPHPKQLKALKSDARELLFGGALGGGKSDFLLMSCLQYMDTPGYASAIFRKSLTDLSLPGALMDRTKEWLSPFLRSRQFPNRPVNYIPSEHTYYFNTYYPDGSKGADAKLVFGYIGEANIKDRYQSAEFQTICFDEISQWDTPNDYEFMTTRLRKNVCSLHGKQKDGKANYVDGCIECDLKKNSPTRLRAATNPGGRGGNWIMNRFQIIPDPELYPDKRDAIRAIMNDVKVPFVGIHPRRAFVPSLIEDNPSLDQEEYQEHLDHLPPEERSQLRDGNWLARADSRFKREWARYFNVYDDCINIGGTMKPMSFFKKIITTVDPAGTQKEGIVDQRMNRTPKARSFSVISTWGISKDNQLFWLNMTRFRGEIPEVVTEIARIYGIYHPAYVKIESNGLGLGVSQYVRNLGIPIKKIFKGVDKLENSTAAQLLMKAGRVWFPDNAIWINECEDEVFSWIGLPGEQDDIVDTLSDAAVDLGPMKEVLDSEVASKLTTRINIHRIPAIKNAQLDQASPTGKHVKGLWKNQSVPIKYESI